MKKKLSYFQIENFDELNEKKVIIFGASNGGNIVYDMLLRNNVEEKNILFFCDNNSNLWGGEEREAKKIVSPNELEQYCKNHKDTIIVIATVKKRFCLEIIEQLEKLNVQNKVILNEELIVLEKTLFSIQNLKRESNEIKFYRKILFEEQKNIIRYEFYDQLLENIDRKYQFISLFLPAKVGSSTISSSLPFEYPKIKIHSKFWMSSEDKVFYKKYVKKIIIGVREPIATNMSLIYELKSSKGLIKTGKRWIWTNPQEVLDYYIIDSILNCIKRRNEKRYGFEEELGYSMIIQSWFEDELKEGLNINIFDYPFNKKLGYQIIKIDECEILLYRLESMNSLEEVFGKFLNIKDFRFVRNNEAKSKWYNESYRNFLKNVTMPQEYIDISYNSKYMKHFYTEEEISKFREKWEKHVDPNWSIQGE